MLVGCRGRFVEGARHRWLSGSVSRPDLVQSGPVCPSLVEDDLNELAVITERAYDEGAVIAQAVDSDAGILVFACGMGDGLYPAWIGTDSSGQVACLVIDLGLLSRGEFLTDCGG